MAKTLEWASTKCGIPEWTIKALAREFARKRTSIGHYLGAVISEGHSLMNRLDWKFVGLRCKVMAALAYTRFPNVGKECQEMQI